MFNIIRIVVAFLILFSPSLSFLNNGHRESKVTYHKFLKISSNIEDVAITSRGFKNDPFLEDQNPLVSDELQAEETTLSLNSAKENKKHRRSQFFETSMFLLRAAVVGVATGGTGLFGFLL